MGNLQLTLHKYDTFPYRIIGRATERKKLLGKYFSVVLFSHQIDFGATTKPCGTDGGLTVQEDLLVKLVSALFPSYKNNSLYGWWCRNDTFGHSTLFTLYEFQAVVDTVCMDEIFWWNQSFVSYSWCAVTGGFPLHRWREVRVGDLRD